MSDTKTTEEKVTKGEKPTLPPWFKEISDNDKKRAFVEALNWVNDNWGKKGETSKYSTGLPILDSYLGGGYGLNNAGEVMLVHATSKTFKSTLAMQFLKTPIEKGEKVGMILLEGELKRAMRNMKQLYFPNYSRFDSLTKNFPAQIEVLPKAAKKGGFSMEDLILWMKQLVATKGIKLFLIDPIGYIADYANEMNIPDYKKESKFMKDLGDFADETGSTVICIHHNVKSGETAFRKPHREAAAGGSQSFTKSATKVIEVRAEGWLDKKDPTKGRLLSLEMYMARDVQDWRANPVLINVNFEKDGEGKHFTMRKYHDKKADGIFEDDTEDRELWFGQVDKSVPDKSPRKEKEIKESELFDDLEEEEDD